jgi:hypothetical protein
MTESEVINKLCCLIVNVKWLVEHGKSEAASKEIDDAMAGGWTAMGWNQLIDQRKRARQEARDGC